MKILGTIKGQTIELDGPSGLPTDQRVEIEIRPVEGATDAARTKLEETDASGSAQKRKRVTTLSDLLSKMGVTREELDARIETEPQFEFIRRADEHRKKMDKRRGSKSDMTTQWIREDRDR